MALPPKAIVELFALGDKWFLYIKPVFSNHLKEENSVLIYSLILNVCDPQGHLTARLRAVWSGRPWRQDQRLWSLPCLRATSRRMVPPRWPEGQTGPSLRRPPGPGLPSVLQKGRADGGNVLKILINVFCFGQHDWSWEVHTLNLCLWRKKTFVTI